MLHIAGGIILAVLILAFWPLLLMLGALLFVLAIVIVGIVVLWLSTPDEVHRYLLFGGLALILSLLVRASIVKRRDEKSRKAAELRWIEQNHSDWERRRIEERNEALIEYAPAEPEPLKEEERLAQDAATGHKPALIRFLMGPIPFADLVDKPAFQRFLRRERKFLVQMLLQPFLGESQVSSEYGLSASVVDFQRICHWGKPPQAITGNGGEGPIIVKIVRFGDKPVD